jgi:acyl-CoA reductase-like NAD-dependent aldehyde dehydrogenase
MDSIRRYSMFIGGDWVDADERFEIRSPATEELVASVAKGSREHADRAIAAASAAHADGRWRKTPPAGRAAVLDAIAGRLGERVDELAVLEALENGAPVRQAGAFQIAFTGSTAVGREIMRMAAGNVKRLTLELGRQGAEHRPGRRRPGPALTGRLDRRAYQLLLSAPPD